MNENKAFTEDEAIELFEWRAKHSNGKSYEMLAKWLKELKRLRKFREEKNTEFWKEFNSIKSFRVKNEKLCDLARDMWDVFECDPYGPCKYRQQCGETYECVFKTRMKALGIEVAE